MTTEECEGDGIRLEPECYYCNEGVGEHKSIHIECVVDNCYKWAHTECVKRERMEWQRAHGKSVVPGYAPEWIAEVVK